MASTTRRMGGATAIALLDGRVADMRLIAFAPPRLAREGLARHGQARHQRSRHACSHHVLDGLSDEPQRSFECPRHCWQSTNLGHTSSTWSRKRPVPQQQHVSLLSSPPRPKAARPARGCWATARNGSSYSGAMKPGRVGNGSARIAVDLARAQHLQQLDGEVLLQHQRHLRVRLMLWRTRSGSR